MAVLTASLSQLMMVEGCQETARPFVDGLTALDRNQLMGVGLDPGGSRVLEAALQGPAAGPKARKKLLRQLQGGWGLLAAQPGGSHVVEAAYTVAVRPSTLSHHFLLL